MPEDQRRAQSEMKYIKAREKRVSRPAFAMSAVAHTLAAEFYLYIRKTGMGFLVFLLCKTAQQYDAGRNRLFCGSSLHLKRATQERLRVMVSASHTYFDVDTVLVFVSLVRSTTRQVGESL
ncbi:unnamed protein product [Ectocarpus sp. 12 AP-2014]